MDNTAGLIPSTQTGHSTANHDECPLVEKRGAESNMNNTPSDSCMMEDNVQAFGRLGHAMLPNTAGNTGGRKVAFD